MPIPTGYKSGAHGHLKAPPDFVQTILVFLGHMS
jgi:hypothetical protein